MANYIIYLGTVFFFRLEDDMSRYTYFKVPCDGQFRTAAECTNLHMFERVHLKPLSVFKVCAVCAVGIVFMIQLYMFYTCFC